ncbi:MAG: type III-B CRISPR module RAMP protein Cmr1 [Dissulfuribacterales bacterium]
MTINIARFYKRERMKFDCEIITPMFLGNSNQEAELRAAPFKGLLRYWWRVAEGHRYVDAAALLKAENAVFGSADDSGGKSQVAVEVCPLTDMPPQNKKFPKVDDVDYPECEKTKKKTNPLNYLAGRGLIHYKNGILHSYFAPAERFQIRLVVSYEKMEAIEPVLALIRAFGAIGSRSRNGWGCFSLLKKQEVLLKDCISNLQDCIRNFSEIFDDGRDYPHCLGKDKNGLLLWKTKNTQKTWELCMRDLADIYIKTRTKLDVKDVKSDSPSDRHLLGYPVTNHSINLKNWGKKGRHASALRLIVRKEADGYRGYILHLPHLFSEKMWPNEKDRQIRIWQQVHGSLDQLCERVKIEEVKA